MKRVKRVYNILLSYYLIIILFIVVVVSPIIFYGSCIDTTIIFSQSPSIYQPLSKLKGLDHPFTSFIVVL